VIKAGQFHTHAGRLAVATDILPPRAAGPAVPGCLTARISLRIVGRRAGPRRAAPNREPASRGTAPRKYNPYMK
jgi:hypothetical protein